MSWRASSGNERTPAPMLVAVVVAVALFLLGAAVPCAQGQDCDAPPLTLAKVSTEEFISLGPTIGQRVRIGDSPVVIANINLLLSANATGTVEAQIRHDANGAPAELVSILYVSGVQTGTATGTYWFEFANVPALSANTHYWIVFTSAAAIGVKWPRGQVQSTTTSIDANTGAAFVMAESLPADQVTGPSSVWTLYQPSTVIFSITIAGCVTASVPSPNASSLPGSTTSTPVVTPSSTTSLPSLTPVSSRTPQARASATPVVLAPITANVTSSFDSTQTALNITAPASSNGTSGVTQPGVTVVSQFSEVRVGNRTLPPPAIQELTVSNDTSTNATTYTYSSQIDNSTDVEQAFTFFEQKTSGNFSGLTFDIGASSIKWSIQLINTNSTAAAAGLTLRYSLTGLSVINGGNSSGGAVVVASREQVVVQRETPRANMTTYLVPLFLSTSTTTTTTTTTTTVAQVELFDVALIDGSRFVPISHSIVRTTADEAEYVVELMLPAFNESLFYDPSIGLGVLLGRSDRDGDGSSSESNVGLIVGVAVAVPVAVALVLVVIGAALLISWRRKRLVHHRSSGNINFGADADHEDRL